MNKLGKTRTGSGGIGFVGLLQIAFIVLKLIGKINWSWFWVLSPIWITASIVVILFAVAFVVIGTVYMQENEEAEKIVDEFFEDD